MPVPDCPPVPPPPVEVVEGAPAAEVPLPTLRWLADRDLYAVQLEACHHDARSELLLVEAERDAAVWLAEERARQVEALQQRPRWRTVALAGGVGVVVGSVATAWVVSRLR